MSVRERESERKKKKSKRKKKRESRQKRKGGGKGKEMYIDVAWVAIHGHVIAPQVGDGYCSRNSRARRVRVKYHIGNGSRGGCRSALTNNVVTSFKFHVLDTGAVE